MTEPPSDAEEFERIPWGHLSSSPPSRTTPATWRLVAYGLAGAIAVAAVTTYLTGRPTATPPTTTSLAASTSAAAPATTLPAVPSTEALPESDLMAISSDLAAGEAAAWAEVLTEAYWAVDGSGTSAFSQYLSPDTALPVPADGQRVFVESVSALTVTEESPGLYRVVVRASRLSALGAAEYRRLPVTALAWTLRWQPQGWQLVDLPEMVDLPPLLPPGAFPNEPVPEPIASAASAIGSVLGGGQVGDLWRVVIAVTDPHRGSWPIVRWYSPDGIAVGVTTSG